MLRKNLTRDQAAKAIAKLYMMTARLEIRRKIVIPSLSTRTATQRIMQRIA